MQSLIDTLRAEVLVLRSELADLRALVTEIRGAVFGVEAGAGETAGDESEFSVISESPQVVSDNNYPAVLAEAAAAGYPEQPAPSAPAHITWEQRERICHQVGLFIRGALQGDISGSSGRERLPLRSRVWLVARSFTGQEFDPPRIFHRWDSAHDLVRQGGGFGRAVFVGLPSLGDCRFACKAAHLQPPTTSEQ